MKFSEKIKMLLRLPLTLIQSLVYPAPAVMSDVETVKYICDNNCSVSRFGDGEFDIMCGVGIKFQKADKVLQNRLCDIAKSHTQKSLLICISDVFYSNKQLKNKLVSKDAKWWSRYLKVTRGIWHKRFRGRLYGDTNISRFYMEVKDKNRTPYYVKEIKKIWNDRNIVFVEGSKSRLGIGNELFDNARSVRRILCPSKNAFDKYDKILTTVLNLTSESDLIICALGPTATVLSYDLSLNGRQALDLGHIDIEYEWFLMGAQEKQSVNGKDMNEVNGVFCEDETKLPTNVIAEIL